MNDVTGMPQTAVVIGGASEIAVATLRALGKRRLRHAVLLGRNDAALAEAAALVRSAGVENVSTGRLDVVDTATIPAAVGRVMDELGTVDLVLVAAGFLGESDLAVVDEAIVATTIATNFTGPAAAITGFAQRLRAQGSGRIVVLSSVAGARVRRSNFVYGSAKAGLDGFALGLDAALSGSGVSVLVARPGFVHTRMTAGKRPAPFAVTPERAAADIVRGLETGATVVWSPPTLRWVFAALSLIPHRLWRYVRN